MTTTAQHGVELHRRGISALKGVLAHKEEADNHVCMTRAGIALVAFSQLNNRVHLRIAYLPSTKRAPTHRAALYILRRNSKFFFVSQKVELAWCQRTGGKAVDGHCTKGISFVKTLGSFGPAHNC